MSAKISHDGIFLPYAGLTNICKLETPSFAESLSAQLARDATISKYFAALPADSYHTTAFGLFNQIDFPTPGAWQRFVDSNIGLFNTLQDTLKKAFTKPLLASNLTLAPCRGVIQIQFELPKEVTEAVKQLADTYKLTDNLGYDFPKFHMTLAYQYRNFPISERERLGNSIQQVFDTAIKTLPDGKLHFAPPRVCYFHDMTGFNIWEKPTCETNPFRSPLPPSRRYGTGSPTLTTDDTAGDEAKEAELTIAP